MSIAIPKGSFARALGLAAVTALGLGLSLTVLEDFRSGWLLATVLIASLIVSPLLAGWLSPRLRYAALFPIGVLVSFSIATVIDDSLYYGNDYLDHGDEGVGFAVFHTAIYGGGTFLIFCAGWIARHYVRRLLGHKATTSHLAIAVLVIVCYSVGLSISLYIWIIDDKWSPLSGWDIWNSIPLLFGSLAVLAGTAIIWSDDHQGRGSLAGLGLSLLYLVVSLVPGSITPSITFLHGLAAVALIVAAIWNYRRWQREEVHR